MNPLWDIDIFEMDWLDGLFETNMIQVIDLKTIQMQDRQYHILKRTGVLLMPRWQKFKCSNKEELIRALQIEKVWDRFQKDMEAVRMAETSLNEAYTKEVFLDYILMLAVRDFKVGNDREDLVINWLKTRGWIAADYSDKTAYSNEGKGIDIVCTHPEKGTRNIQVKSQGFGNSPDSSQYKQLKKMVTNNCYLAIVNQYRKNRITIFTPQEIKIWYKSVEKRVNND